MVKAQWLGGPNDGEVIEIPSDAYCIVTPGEMKPASFLEDTMQPTTDFKTVTHQVVRRRNGGLYIRYNGKTN